MSELNVNIPVFTCLVRNEFLYNFKKGQGEFTEAAILGVASVPGRVLGFHALLSNGALYGRLPIHALVHTIPGTLNIKNVSDLQLWDAPSEHISCIEYDFLKETRCHVYLPSVVQSGQQTVSGQYMFTLDWWGSSYSENAGALGWKSAHFIRLDNGYFAAQPNNRILWENPAWIKKVEKPDYALTERVWKCEGAGTTTDEYFYDKIT